MAEIGLYGKLPAHGDFVERHLSSDFVMVWDDWLQRSLATSQEQMGRSWLEVYLSGPIWRFVLSPGIVDGQVWGRASMCCVGVPESYCTLLYAIVFGLSLFVNVFGLSLFIIVFGWLLHFIEEPVRPIVIAV